AKSGGGIRAVSSEPKTSGSEIPPKVTLINNITPDATAPAASPAAKPVQKRIFRRNTFVFIRKPYVPFSLLTAQREILRCAPLVYTIIEIIFYSDIQFACP